MPSGLHRYIPTRRALEESDKDGRAGLDAIIEPVLLRGRGGQVTTTPYARDGAENVPLYWIPWP